MAVDVNLLADLSSHENASCCNGNKTQKLKQIIKKTINKKTNKHNFIVETTTPQIWIFSSIIDKYLIV